MKSIIKVGIMTFAFGLVLIGAGTVNAQDRRDARRERRDQIRDARQEYREDLRSGKNMRKSAKEYRKEVRDARRDYRRDVRRGSNGWYIYNNGRRGTFYPFATYVYRNGRFYRRY